MRVGHQYERGSVSGDSRRLTFIALAKTRANGVDHCLCSNVELYRREYVDSGVLRDLRKACDAMRLAAGFIFAQRCWAITELSGTAKSWRTKTQILQPVTDWGSETRRVVSSVSLQICLRKTSAPRDLIFIRNGTKKAVTTILGRHSKSRM